MGFEFTHFAEFAWAQMEPEEGKYNFGWLDTAVVLAAKYKLRVVMCTPTATPSWRELAARASSSKLIKIQIKSISKIPFPPE